MEPFRLHRAFTLIELLVVLGIITVIMSIVLSNQNTFNKSLILANTAYDIALTLRSAETYGLSSRAAGVTANSGYGLHFQNSTPGSFTLFADTYPAAICSTPDCKPGDYVYTEGIDARVQTYVLGNGMTVNDFCAFAGSWSCTYAHNGFSGGLTSLDISFNRPNPNPFISTNGAYAAPPFSVTAACVAVTSPVGGSRFISIAASGQIIANAASCP